MQREIASFLEAAWEAADRAGAVIRAAWDQPREIDYKGAIDLVTPIDCDCERAIVATLQARFPEHSILAEENTVLAGAPNGYRWVIDPLDGTTNFAHAYPHVAVSIALEQDGRTIVGLVYDPLRRECFRAARGFGAFLNGNAISVSKVSELDKALLATGFPYDRRDKADCYLAYFKAFMVRTQGIRRNGSAALDLCYVACGRVDGYWESKLRPWDVAAGALIVEEAGGIVSDFCGNRFIADGSETLASNGAIHDQMIEVAKAVRELSLTRS
ncbi:MAG TPA: inositol monophosphatase family protein [Candidatus Eisenbacteria bacterium]|nr:inositol monophosphatase family protein [Candidatus Eisenbacteria bacterium]